MSKKRTKVRVNLTRRDVLNVGLAAVGSAIVAQFLTTGPLSPFAEFKQEMLEGNQEEGHSNAGHHWGMLINLDVCIGCAYCQRACNATNDVWEEQPWNLVVEEKTSTGRTFFFTRPCLHCQDAPCVEVCPVQATYVREDGIVMMDYDRCIGCRYCQVACPYDARRFNWQERNDENPYIPTWGIAEVERRPRGVIEKCTFCVHRIDEGLAKGLTPGVDHEATPACVNICPVKARLFGDLNDPSSEISRFIAENPVFVLREELGTKPSVFYVPPKEGL